MTCFICKKEIDLNGSISDTVRIKVPTGALEYVHSYHPGVQDEVQFIQEENKQ